MAPRERSDVRYTIAWLCSRIGADRDPWIQDQIASLRQELRRLDDEVARARGAQPSPQNVTQTQTQMENYQ